MVYSRGALELLKMAELREIGHKIGASDTNKMELIDEILVKQPRPPGKTETEKLERDLKLAIGDYVQTYELRDKLLYALEKLKKYEIKGGD